MSSHGAPTVKVTATGARVAVIASLWHTEVMDGLIEGANQACAQAGAVATLIRVPGSFELPIVAKACASSLDYDVVVALGVVIRGGTPHFEYVCSATSHALAQVALDFLVPVGFGLLTCDTDAQALDRAGLPDSSESKGLEATQAALLTWLTLSGIAGEQTP